MLSKLTHLLVAAATVTGGAAITTGAVVGAAGPAMACGASGPTKADIRYADSLPILRSGSHGATVLGVQYYLRDNGASYLTGTGTYAANTTKAVKHFQHQNHLTVTGVVGHATWRKIIVNDFHLPWKAPNPQLSSGASLRTKRGAELTNLTRRLHGLPWFQYNHGQTHYNGKLLADVKVFQKRVGVRNSGVFGAQTTKKMVTVIAIAGHEQCQI